MAWLVTAAAPGRENRPEKKNVDSNPLGLGGEPVPPAGELSFSFCVSSVWVGMELGGRGVVGVM